MAFAIFFSFAPVSFHSDSALMSASPAVHRQSSRSRYDVFSWARDLLSKTADGDEPAETQPVRRWSPIPMSALCMRKVDRQPWPAPNLPPWRNAGISATLITVPAGEASKSMTVVKTSAVRCCAPAWIGKRFSSH